MMKYIPILIHTIPLLLSIASIVTSVIVYKQKLISQKWCYYFIHMLICVSIFPVVQALFALLFEFSNFSKERLTLFYTCTIFSAIIYLFNSLFHLSLAVAEHKNELLLRKTFKIIIISLVLYFISVLSFNIKALFDTILIICGIYMVLIFLLHLIKIKKVIKDSTKHIYTINIALSLIMLFFLTPYYFFSDSPHTASIRFPVISIYCLTMHSLNIIYNVRFINKIINKSKSSEVLEPAKETLDSIINKYTITKREAQILVLFVDKKSRNEISNELGIAKRTVDKHIENIYRKCKVKTVSELFTLINS